MRTSLVLLAAMVLLSFDQRERWTIVSAAEGQASAVSPVLDLPDNIVIDPRLRDVVAEMLRASHTFREQCRYLGAARVLHVNVSLESQQQSAASRQDRADCRLIRYQYGRIEAMVRLWTTKNVQELIAHEFEHVREYAEGARFLAMSVKHPRRVWITFDGHYETARAIETGERVTDETARYRARQSSTTLAHRAP
jgi:hypothetical protein